MLGETAVSADLSAVCADSNSMMGMSGLMDTSVTTLWTANSTFPRIIDGRQSSMEATARANRIGHGDAERRYIDPDLNVLYPGSHDTPRILSRVTQTPGRYCRFADECDSPPPETAEATPSALSSLWGLLYTARASHFFTMGMKWLPGGGDPDNRRVLPFHQTL